MKAMNLPASRRRNQVVILSGVRPGSKLITSARKSARILSETTRFALQMALVCLWGCALLLCVAMVEATDASFWKFALVAALLPAVSLIMKGGLK